MVFGEVTVVVEEDARPDEEPMPSLLRKPLMPFRFFLVFPADASCWSEFELALRCTAPLGPICCC